MIATRLPAYRPHDHPARDAIKGVTTGARNPPTFPPVFRIPHAAPTCLSATSMVDAQNGPSHQDANPIASDSDRTAMPVPGTIVHEYLGHIDWALAFVFGIASVPLASVGASVALWMRERSLTVMYGLGIALLSGALLAFAR